MHELVHVAVLVFTLCGAGSLLLLLLWPLLADNPLPGPSKKLMGALIGLGVASLLVEWMVVH